MVSDEALVREAAQVSAEEGIDMSPEGGATIAAASQLLQDGSIGPGEKVVTFNTGAGWLYRVPGELVAL
jgi:threonine synthase